MDITSKREDISLKFEELINRSRLKRKKTCAEFSDDLYQNMLDFIFDNIKIGRVLDEVDPPGEWMPSDDLTSMTVNSVVAQFECVARALSVPLKLVTSQVMAQKLIDLLQQDVDISDNNCHLLDANMKIKVMVLMELIKKVNAENGFDKLNFVKCLASKWNNLTAILKIMKKQTTLSLMIPFWCQMNLSHLNWLQDVPVEVVWLLNEEAVVSFRSYLFSWYEDENWVEYFSLSVKSLCCDGCLASADLRKKIVQLVISALLKMCYVEASEKDLTRQKAKETLFKSLSYVDRNVQTLSSDESKRWLCVYKVIRELNDTSTDTIRTFFHDVLIESLQEPCDLTVQSFSLQDCDEWGKLTRYSKLLTVEEAIACQEKWTSEFLTEAIISKYQQIMEGELDRKLTKPETKFAQLAMFIIVFRNEGIIQIFERAVVTIKSEAVNIQILAHLLTVFLIYVEGSFKLFDDFLERCIVETFENCVFSQLRLLLLLRRQAALEGSHVSPSYSHWFEKTFVVNNSSLGLNSKRTIQFFFKALSDLVPYERAEYLKVHILKSVQVPAKFKNYVDDYVALAKTRLADLNESLEESGGIFCHDSLNDEQSKVIEQGRVDVAKVLKLYEDSGRVPTTIMEASIFRKPYFIGRFLPALLVPRKLPVGTDVRAKIIDDLNRAGKIPASMLRSYQKKCDQFEETSSSGNPRDNVQYVVDSLGKLPDLVLNIVNGEEATKGLTSWLSSISRKIKLIFGDVAHESSSGVLNIDLAFLNVKDDHIKASYAIMNVFCRACAAMQRVRVVESVAFERDLVKFRWASRFVSMLVSFPRLIESLYVHIWSTVCYKPNLLEKEHISGLAILVCHLACFGQTFTIRLPSVTLSESEYYHSFVDLLSSQILLSSKNSVRFFIRWCCCYLQYAVVAFETLTTDVNQVAAGSQEGSCYVPATMVMKLRYLYNKLKFRKSNLDDQAFLNEKTWDILQIVMESLNELEVSQDLSNVGFRQWLEWELKIEEDFLHENERQQYYNSTIYEHFTSCTNQEDGDHVAYRETATQLFSVLMDHYSSGMDHVRSSIETNLVKILQDIVYFIGSSRHEETAENSPGLSENIWLLDCFIFRNKKVNEAGNPSIDLQRSCEIMSFFRLTTLLPPWMLFCNSEWDSLTEQNTKKLACFLNNYLKPYIFQQTFSVPFDFTVYLLKAFFPSSSKSITESIRLSEEMFRQLTREVPLVFGSVVHYWGQLKTVCHRYLLQSKLLQQFNSYHLFLDNALDDQCIAPENIADEPGLAYAFFLYLKERLESSSMLVKEIAHISPRITKLLDSLSASRRNKIILYLFDNIMAYLVDLIFQGNKKKDREVWFDIAMGILSRCPDVLRVFTRELDDEVKAVRLLLVAENFSKSLPVIFFRIILRFPKQEIQKIMSLEVFIEAMLVMYIDCSSFYKEYAESSLSMSHCKLDLQSFVEVTRFVKDYLMDVSPTLLRAVPKDLIKMSPSEIQAFFIKIE